MEKILQEGVLLVDKPAGVSSHFVVNWARKASGVKRVGHTGTLDPLATGLLIILIGKNYTKLQSGYLKQDKEYECTATLGIITDSYDIEGNIISRAEWGQVSKIFKQDILAILPEFTGKIEQQVPFFSAVKVGGRKLYKLARGAEHVEVNLPIRTVTIHSLELTQFQVDAQNQEVLCSFRVSCSSGTYIRSLVHDIGQKLGCGATVKTLRRTKIGSISITEAGLCPVLFK